jgi:hypothetical protein
MFHSRIFHPDTVASVWFARRDGSLLDSTRVCSSSTPAAAAASAGQAADDNAEERDDGIDNGLESGGNGVNNCHDAVADRSELWMFVSMTEEVGGQGGERRTMDLMHDTTAPMVAVL